MKKKVITVISGVLVFLFTYAAISKAMHPIKFYGEINLQPFPDWMTPILTIGIPLLELLAVILLVMDKKRLLGLYLSAYMMLLFTLFAMMKAFDIRGWASTTCGCGGVIEYLPWNVHFYLNAFFLLSSIVGIVLVKLLKNGTNIDYRNSNRITNPLL